VTSASLLDLGTLGYEEAYARQLELVAARQRGEGADTLILVEHPPVITLGRRRTSRDNVVNAGPVPVVEIERGGDVTYHGPGQLVGYPIVLLGGAERDLHRFLRLLEEGIIGALADLGLPAGRREGATGVWIDGARKIASIGLACRRWVMFHGLALNVSTDLTAFTRINPCGFEAGVMTSVARELGRDVTLADVKPALALRLGEALGRDFR
jgi:lipoyl(octanoyl) transferase